jgi:hypothetical protein
MSAEARIAALFRRLLPGVAQVDLLGAGTCSLLGGAELVAAAREMFPSAEIVDWTHDPDFDAGANWEVRVTESDLAIAMAAVRKR